MEVTVAIIVTTSTLLGSLVPQILIFFLKDREFKKELRKEYKANRVQAYKHLFTIISEMWHSDTSMDDRIKWADKSNTELEDFKIHQGRKGTSSLSLIREA